jgi:hypothetical protein
MEQVTQSVEEIIQSRLVEDALDESGDVDQHHPSGDAGATATVYEDLDHPLAECIQMGLAYRVPRMVKIISHTMLAGVGHLHAHQPIVNAGWGLDKSKDSQNDRSEPDFEPDEPRGENACAADTAHDSDSDMPCESDNQELRLDEFDVEGWRQTAMQMKAMVGMTRIMAT